MDIRRLSVSELRLNTRDILDEVKFLHQRFVIATYGRPMAVVVNIDRKTRNIQLSIKAKDSADQQEAMQRLSQSNERESAGTTSLGALLRAKMDSGKDNG